MIRHNYGTIMYFQVIKSLETHDIVQQVLKLMVGPENVDKKRFQVKYVLMMNVIGCIGST